MMHIRYVLRDLISYTLYVYTVVESLGTYTSMYQYLYTLLKGIRYTLECTDKHKKNCASILDFKALVSKDFKTLACISDLKWALASQNETSKYKTISYKSVYCQGY